MQTDTQIQQAERTPVEGVPRDGEGSRIGLLDLLLLLARRKRLVLGLAVAGGLSLAGLGSLLPRLYTAAAVIMPPQQQRSATGALLGELGALAGVGGADLTLKTPAELYIGLLGSRTIADAMAARFELTALYRTKHHSDTLKKLSSRTHFSTGKDTLIKISVDDTDAARSAALANAYIDELYKQTARLAITESSQRRLFFEGQLDQERIALGKAEVAIKGQQEHTGLISLTGQAEVIIRAIAEVQAEIAGREVALENLRSGATSQNPEVQRREAELASLRAHLRALQETESKSHPSGRVTATSQFPAAGMQYVQGLRELQYHQALFEVMAKQYEAARIDEAKEAPVIQVVDRATTPDKSSGLSTQILAAIGSSLGALLACLIAFIGHSMGGPGDAAKLAALRQSIFRFGRSESR